MNWPIRTHQEPPPAKQVAARKQPLVGRADDGCLEVAFCLDLGADNAAERRYPLIDDAVIDLHAITAFAEHPMSIQGVQVLRHIGLGGAYFAEQIAHVLFTVAQATDDLQAHRCRHDPKQLGGQLKYFVWSIEIGWDGLCFKLCHRVGADVEKFVSSSS